jgi:hypothetical protein
MPDFLVAIGVGIMSIIWQVASRVVSVLIQPLINELQKVDGDIPISPADAADMVERNIISHEEGAGYAAASGMRPEAFALTVLDTGEPPGLEQMLSLWRRGLLDEGTLRRMIAYSRVRTEWTDHVLALAHDTMSPADALTAALKGVISEGEAQDLFEKAGGLADQWQILLDTAGDAIGVEQALTLWNHGLISDADVGEVIRHSRINPIFEPMAKLLHYKFLPPFQIVTAVKDGMATPQQATEWLLADGYPPDQVAAVVQGAAAGTTNKHKTITEAQIADLFETGVLTRAAADAELQAIGYPADQTDLILSLYDRKRQLSMAQAAVGQVRKVFLAGRVDRATASNMLDALSIDPTARDSFLDIWTVEAHSEIRSLSMAQVGGLYKKGLLSESDAIGRWRAMGYSEADAALLLADYGGPAPAGSPAAAKGG